MSSCRGRGARARGCSSTLCPLSRTGGWLPRSAARAARRRRVLQGAMASVGGVSRGVSGLCRMSLVTGHHNVDGRPTAGTTALALTGRTS